MSNKVKPIICQPSEGRSYKIGKAENTEVIFKADGAEVDNKYAITEWWIEKGAPGPDPHVHDTQDELMYIIEGPVTALVDETWTTLEKGGMVVVPAGTQHTFKNESDHKVGIFSILMDGAYEAFMPQITAMYKDK